MTNSKTTKRALLSSVLALFLCFTMLLGTTFAWFTDSVTSDVNIIQTGTLKVDLELLKEDGTWTSLKDSHAPIFNNDKWEPGYTAVKTLKVVNKGTLALKYALAIVPVGEVSELAEVIDVYLLEGIGNVDRTTQFDESAHLGTLADVINKGIMSGSLEADDKTTEAVEGAYTATLVLKMSEDVGNEYQGLKIGDSFTVQLLATQYTSESDSIDEKYDENAPFSMWDGVVPTEMPETLVVDTEKHLISINDAAAFAYLNTLVNSADFFDNYGSAWQYSIELNADIDLANKEWTPITLRNFVAFEGNRHTIKNLYVTSEADNAGLFAKITCNDNGHTNVRNFTIDGASVSGKQYVGAFAGDAIQAAFSNVNVNNATVIGTKYVGGLTGRCSVSITSCSVKNSTVTGSDKTVGGLVGYSVGDPGPITVKGNTVENVTVIGAYNVGGLLGAAQKETVENNTVKNVNVISTTALPANASSNEVRTGEVIARNAGGVTVGNNTVNNVTTMPKSGETVVLHEESGLYWNNNSTKHQGVYYVFNASDFEKAMEYFVVQSHSGESNKVTFELISDIDMSGVNWDGWNVMFITLNGNGHTISNLNANGGLFGYAGAVTINDLTLENVTSSGNQAGTFAACAEGATFNNCYLKGNNTVTYVDADKNENGVGAITGVTINSNLNVTIAEGTTVAVNLNELADTEKTIFVNSLIGCKFVKNTETGECYPINAGTITNKGNVTVSVQSRC